MKCIICRSNETHKAALRSERRIREMEFTAEEDKKKFNRYGELAEKLQVGDIMLYFPSPSMNTDLFAMRSHNTEIQ